MVEESGHMQDLKHCDRSIRSIQIMKIRSARTGAFAKCLSVDTSKEGYDSWSPSGINSFLCPRRR